MRSWRTSTLRFNECGARIFFAERMKEGQGLREMRYLETLCAVGHQERVKPAGIVADEAIFGSAANLCQRGRSERPIVESTPVYEDDESLPLEALPQDKKEDKP